MKLPNLSSLLERLLAPSVALMARLRFSQKLVLIGGAFALTCVVFAGILVVRMNDDIAHTRIEAEAGTALSPLRHALQAAQAHRLHRQRLNAGDTSVIGPLTAHTKVVDAELDKFVAWATAFEQDPSLLKTVASIRASWKDATASDSAVEDAVIANNAAIDKLVNLMAQVAGSTGAVLDPEPDTYYLAQAVTFLLPRLSEQTARQNGLGVQVIGNGAVWVDDRVEIMTAQSMLDQAKRSLQGDFRRIAGYDPSMDKLLGPKLKAAVAGMDAVSATIQSQILGAEELNASVPMITAKGLKAEEAIYALYDASVAHWDELIQARLSALRGKRAFTMLALCLALLVSTYLFLGFTRSTRRALSELSAASSGLAQGRFPEHIEVGTRDELHQIATGMEGACGTLRAFAAAQAEMFGQHEAGEIDYRMDPDPFPGAFGRMAHDINDLVGSHIALNAKAMEIVSSYARGDLSVDMEPLPGKKAEITDAVDGVKIGLVEVNAELKRLVDAAVAGDFSQRGKAERFQYAYRDMIESLNELMDTADAGLNEVGQLLAAVAEGDLTQRITAQLDGQFGQVAADANRTVDTLSEIVGRIRSGADTINTGAREIAAGNADLSSRTEQQAASLEETASSMEELTSTVRQNADNARQANQLAIGAADVAVKGGAVVDQVVITMSEINSSSKKIVDIIGVIDGIAFQTNILALNAAVEAARAGEQGRGFAVVASEVRSLAQRSAAAAKEIKGLIGDSVDRVQAGTQLVDQAGKTMHEIVSSVKRVTDIMAEISAASAEQSAGIEQVNQTVLQMDGVTQQNAALVEEATAAARSLEDQAEGLSHAVAAFQLDIEQAPETVAPSPGAGGKARAPAARHAARAAPTVAVAATARPRAGHGKAAATRAGGGDEHWQEF